MEITKYERLTVLPKVRDCTKIAWRSAAEMSVTPTSLKRLFQAGRVDRYFDGTRYRYQFVTQSKEAHLAARIRNGAR